MAEHLITCPHCNRQIPLTQALTSEIEEKVREKYEAEASEKDKEIRKKLREIERSEKEIQELRVAINEEVATKVADEKKGLMEEIRKKVEDEHSLELNDLRKSSREVRRKLREAQEKEIELRRERRELEESREELELEVQRKLDKERNSIREGVEKRLKEEHLLEVREKDEVLRIMKSQIDDLKRRVEQGSEQLRGEVMELELEGLLSDTFPQDEIIPVPKGTLSISGYLVLSELN